MEQVRRRWREKLEARMPPRAEIVARNAAITATYAGWYLAHPSLCKWAGMAVFGSRQAGIFLRQLVGPDRDGWPALLPEGIRRAQADLIRDTNNAVFDDIGWAHEAFLAPDRGLAAVEAGLADLPTHRELLRGFQAIDLGRRLADADPARAEQLVWDGTRRLFEHEQRHTVEPYFNRLHPVFAAIFSAVAVADFRMGDARIVQPWRPWFARDMLRRGRARLRESGALRPDITRIDHRWYWLEHEVFPCWQQVERSGQARLRARMQQLAGSTAFTTTTTTATTATPTTTTTTG